MLWRALLAVTAAVLFAGTLAPTQVAALSDSAIEPSDADGSASVSGQVLDTAGSAIAGVKIDIFSAHEDNPRRRADFLGFTKTDEAGGFALAGRPGCYVLVFQAPEGAQFTNDSRWFEAPLCVEPGQAITDLIVTVKGEAPTGGLLGGAVFRGPFPAQGVKVDLFLAQANGARGSFLGHTLTGADGTFGFPVPAGCYVLTMIAPEGELFDNGSRWFQPVGCVEDGEQLLDFVGVLGGPAGAAPVVAFEQSDFGGQAWPLAPGVYDQAALASAGGDNAISSVQIADGFAARLCDEDPSGPCVVLSESVSDLGQADNLASYVEIGPIGTTPGLQIELLTNGSFEAGSAGWTSVNGQKLEVWNSNKRGFISSDGRKHLELDANTSHLDAIGQQIQTQPGAAYILTFDVRSRSAEFDTEDEAVIVEWNGEAIKPDGFRAFSPTQWATIAVPVFGTGGLDTLVLRESAVSGANDSTGPLLDNVSLYQINNTFNIPPIAAEDVVVGFANNPTGGSVAANDFDVNGDELVYVLEQPAANGTVQLGPNGEFGYAPNENYTGIDTFTYRVLDQKGGESVGTVNVVVNGLMVFEASNAGLSNSAGYHDYDANGEPTALRAFIFNAKHVEPGTIVGVFPEIPPLFLVGDGGFRGNPNDELSYRRHGEVSVNDQSVPVDALYYDFANKDGIVISDLPNGQKRIGLEDREGRGSDNSKDDLILRFVIPPAGAFDDGFPTKIPLG